MKGHKNCGHSEVQHEILRLAEEAMSVAVGIVMPLNQQGMIGAAESAAVTARFIFVLGLETGIKAGLMDPIGAQQLIDHIDSKSISGDMTASEYVTQDARSLLEAVARL